MVNLKTMKSNFKPTKLAYDFGLGAGSVLGYMEPKWLGQSRFGEWPKISGWFKGKPLEGIPPLYLAPFGIPSAKCAAGLKRNRFKGSA